MHRRRILFAGFVARMEDTRLPKCVCFRRIGGGRGLRWGQEKEWVGLFGWSGTRVTGEMVLDGGGQFIPACIDGSHTLSLLLVSLEAHYRATEDTHTHTGKEHKYKIIHHVDTVHNPMTPSPCE